MPSINCSRTVGEPLSFWAHEAALKGKREWVLLPRQERARLLAEARKKDRRSQALARGLPKAEPVDLDALGEIETPYLPSAGETPEEATRRKIEEDARRWPLVVRKHPEQSFVVDLPQKEIRGRVFQRRAGMFRPRQAGTVYVLQHIDTGLYKIGRTTNMKARMRTLGVGKTTRLISSRYVSNAAEVEKAAHRRYKGQRLPQTEYFRLDSAPSI